MFEKLPQSLCQEAWGFLYLRTVSGIGHSRHGTCRLYGERQVTKCHTCDSMPHKAWCRALGSRHFWLRRFLAQLAASEIRNSNVNAISIYPATNPNTAIMLPVPVPFFA